MALAKSTTLDISYDDAVERTRKALSEQGFGVLTEIDVTATLKANWTGDLVDVAGSAPIVLSDFAIEPPSVGGFVEVADSGLFEVQLTLVRS